MAEEKESKTNKHFWFSISKSAFRIGGFYALFLIDLTTSAALLTFAEILGIFEEF